MVEEHFESESRGLKDLFAPWLGTSSVDEARFFENAVIALDANVLLELYRISSATRDEMLEVLSEVKERIWIPHQAALEYARNRKVAVRARNINVTDFKAHVNGYALKSENAIKSALDAIAAFRKRHKATGSWDPKSSGVDIDEIHESLKNLWNEIKKESVRVKDEIELTSEDPASDAVLDALENLTSGRIGAPYSAFELRKHVEHSTLFRTPNKIPPGYEDEGKDSDLRSSGDYIMWRQLLDYMGGFKSSREKLLILVTNDFKPDWWVPGGGDEGLRPAPELVLEMQNEANTKLLMLSSSDFLLGAAKYLKREVPSDAVDELREVEQREATYASEVMKDWGFRAALERGRLRADSPDFRAALERGRLRADSPDFRAALERTLRGTSPNFRTSFEQAGKVSPELQAAFEQAGKVSPELQALADDVLRNQRLMDAIHDGRNTFGSKQGVDEDEPYNDQDEDGQDS